MKKSELLAATATALLFAAPAMAQDTPPAAQTPPPPATQGDDQPDIIVTATKREQTLLDTPVAVSVTTGATIEQAQIRDLKDLQTVVPSLRINQLQSSANTNFIIRGFGNGANNVGIEPSVGVFIDGVYRSRSAAQIADLPDLKRVEVLRGPQSTLFGKNASAGIISIVTAEPSFKTRGSAEVSYGNYNAVILKGAITGPISDTVAVSLGANYNTRDGYAYDGRVGQQVNNRHRYGVRGQILFQPSADLKFRLIGDYDNINENCCVAGNIINGPTGAILNGVLAPAGVDKINPANLFSYLVYNNFLSSNKIDNYGVSLQGDYNLGKLALTSITSYRVVKSKTNQDSDFTSADLIGENSLDQRIDTFTQELRLATNFEGPLNFLLGGFYFNERIRSHQSIDFGTQFRPYGDQLIRASSGGALNVVTLENTFGALEGNPAKYAGAFFRSGDGTNENYRLKDDSFSIFGQADFKPFDRLTLTGGFNYTDDRKHWSTNVISTDVFSSINLDAPQYAPFRNTLLFQGGLAQLVGTQLGLGRSATAAEIGGFAVANPAAYAAISAGAQANANANQNNPAANPLAGLKGFQFLPQYQNVPNAVEPGRTSDNNLSYTLRAAYKFDNHLNVYVTYATGFKASSINLSRDARPTATDLALLRAQNIAVANLVSGTRFAGPEKSRVIEGGIKGQFRNFAFNAAIFEQTITGFQSNVFSGTGFVLTNAPKQSTFGVEFDGSVTPVSGLTLNGAVTYLDPKYDSFPGGAAIGPGLTLIAADLTGTKPAGIPDFAVSVGGTYTQRLSGSTKLLLRADYDYQTPVKVVETTNPVVAAIEREVKELNLAATLQFSSGLELSAWGRNVTDDHYITTVFSTTAQAGSLSGYPNQPRTYGVTARYKF